MKHRPHFPRHPKTMKLRVLIGARSGRVVISPPDRLPTRMAFHQTHVPPARTHRTPTSDNFGRPEKVGASRLDEALSAWVFRYRLVRWQRPQFREMGTDSDREPPFFFMKAARSVPL